MKHLPIDSIRTDGDTQPRAEIDAALVAEYAAAFHEHAQFPDLIVFDDGDRTWLADGFHRLRAARQVGLEKVPCEVHEGTLDDARWFSYSANQTHGLRRSNADKARAVKAALKHPEGAGLSDAQIAEHVGVTDKTVAKYRREVEGTPEIPESTVRTGRDGRTTNTANIGKRAEPTVGKESPAVTEDAPGSPDYCKLCGSTDFFPDGTCAACRGMDLVPDDEPAEAPEQPPGEPESPAGEFIRTVLLPPIEQWLGRGGSAAILAARLETLAVEVRKM